MCKVGAVSLFRMNLIKGIDLDFGIDFDFRGGGFCGFVLVGILDYP